MCGLGGVRGLFDTGLMGGCKWQSVLSYEVLMVVDRTIEAHEVVYKRFLDSGLDWTFLFSSSAST